MANNADRLIPWQVKCETFSFALLVTLPPPNYETEVHSIAPLISRLAFRQFTYIQFAFSPILFSMRGSPPIIAIFIFKSPINELTIPVMAIGDGQSKFVCSACWTFLLLRRRHSFWCFWIHFFLLLRAKRLLIFRLLGYCWGVFVRLSIFFTANCSCLWSSRVHRRHREISVKTENRVMTDSLFVDTLSSP